MIRTTVTALALVAAPVAAETIEFEADEGVVFARCVEYWADPQDTQCEALFPPNTEPGAYECIALGKGGEVIAVSGGPSMGPYAKFGDLNPASVADMKCRKR